MTGNNPPPPALTREDSTRGSRGHSDDSPTPSVTNEIPTGRKSPTPFLTKEIPTCEKSPTPSLTEGVPTYGESTAPSGKKRDSVFGSYDFGCTPRRSVRRAGREGSKVVDMTNTTSNGVQLQNYSNRFISDRLWTGRHLRLGRGKLYCWLARRNAAYVSLVENVTYRLLFENTTYDSLVETPPIDCLWKTSPIACF